MKFKTLGRRIFGAATPATVAAQLYEAANAATSGPRPREPRLAAQDPRLQRWTTANAEIRAHSPASGTSWLRLRALRRRRAILPSVLVPKECAELVSLARGRLGESSRRGLRDNIVPESHPFRFLVNRRIPRKKTRFA